MCIKYLLKGKHNMIEQNEIETTQNNNSQTVAPIENSKINKQLKLERIITLISRLYNLTKDCNDHIIVIKLRHHYRRLKIFIT